MLLNKFHLFLLIGVSIFISNVEAVDLMDNFHTNTVSKYSKSGSGTLSYDANAERVRVTTGNNKSLTFSRSLQASTAGAFSIDFRSIKRYSKDDSIEIRLILNLLSMPPVSSPPAQYVN